MKKVMLLLILSLLTFLLAEPSHASLLAVDVSGTLPGSTELNGIALGAPTPFSYSAIIDSTGAIYESGNYQYDALTTFTLAGTSYTNNLAIELISAIGGGTYHINLINGLGDKNGILGFAFAQATPDYYDDAPTYSHLFDYVGYEASGILNIDPTHSLTLSAGDYGAPQADIVPEPSTYALLCISLGVIGYARKRMNKQA